MSKIFKVEAEGDTMYFGADDLDGAKKKLNDFIGPIPDSLVKWSEVDEVPDGEEAL